MYRKQFDFSPQGRARVYLLTAVGTLICIAVSFAYDSYDWDTGLWHLGTRPFNNVVLPVILGVPFFYLLLSKMRQLAIAQHELVHLASTDELTSCLNRRAFTAIVEGYLKRMERQKLQPNGALMIADIDHFKNINDQFGHDVGDEALQLIARTIRDAVRDPDIVGRIGGEEFGVFLPAADEANTRAVGERIRQAVANADFRPRGQHWPLSISIGGALFDGRASFADLYRSADLRLYSAKHGGRNRTEIRQLHHNAPPLSAAAAS